MRPLLGVELVVERSSNITKIAPYLYRGLVAVILHCFNQAGMDDLLLQEPELDVDGSLKVDEPLEDDEATDTAQSFVLSPSWTIGSSARGLSSFELKYACNARPLWPTNIIIPITIYWRNSSSRCRCRLCINIDMKLIVASNMSNYRLFQTSSLG